MIKNHTQKIIFAWLFLIATSTAFAQPQPLLTPFPPSSSEATNEPTKNKKTPEPDPCAKATPYPLEKSFATISVHAPRGIIHLHVAKSQEEMERGLMCIRRLPTGNGMAFVFDKEQPSDFWMKDTRIPLDILWLDSHVTIKSLVIDLKETRLGTPIEKIAKAHGFGKYVIEIGAGEAKHLGIHQGTILKIESDQNAEKIPQTR